MDGLYSLKSFPCTHTRPRRNVISRGFSSAMSSAAPAMKKEEAKKKRDPQERSGIKKWKEGRNRHPPRYSLNESEKGQSRRQRMRAAQLLIKKSGVVGEARRRENSREFPSSRGK